MRCWRTAVVAAPRLTVDAPRLTDVPVVTRFIRLVVVPLPVRLVLVTRLPPLIADVCLRPLKLLLDTTVLLIRVLYLLSADALPVEATFLLPPVTFVVWRRVELPLVVKLLTPLRPLVRPPTAVVGRLLEPRVPLTYPLWPLLAYSLLPPPEYVLYGRWCDGAGLHQS